MKYLFFIVILFGVADVLTAQPEFKAELVIGMIESGELKQAEAYLNASKSGRVNDAWWQYAHGRLLMEQSEFRDAMRAFERASKLSPESAYFMLWYGNATCSYTAVAGTLRQFGLARRCRSAYKNVLAIDAGNVDARMHLITFHLQAPGIVGGSSDRASELASEIMGLDSYRGYQARLRIESSNNNADGMISVLQEAVSEYPDSISFRYNLGLIYIQNGFFEKAMQEIRVCSTLDPDNWRYAYQKGRIAALSGHFADEGIAAFNTILVDIPEDMDDQFHSSAYARLAQIYVHLNKFDKATDAVAASLAIIPDNSIALEVKEKIEP